MGCVKDRYGIRYEGDVAMHGWVHAHNQFHFDFVYCVLLYQIISEVKKNYSRISLIKFSRLYENYYIWPLEVTYIHVLVRSCLI